MGEQLLLDLKYTKYDIRHMRPDIAKMVLYHKLARPLEGMPKNWYHDSASIEIQKKKKKKNVVISIAVVGVATTMTAVYINNNNNNNVLESSIEFVEDCLERLQSIPKAIGTAIGIGSTVRTKGGSSSNSSKRDTTATAVDDDDQEDEYVDANNNDEGSNSSSCSSSSRSSTAFAAAAEVHSIKPGTKEAPNYDIDITWLDKVLTTIEKSIKKIFMIKI